MHVRTRMKLDLAGLDAVAILYPVVNRDDFPLGLPIGHGAGIVGQLPDSLFQHVLVRNGVTLKDGPALVAGELHGYDLRDSSLEEVPDC